MRETTISELLDMIEILGNENKELTDRVNKLEAWKDNIEASRKDK